MVDRCAKSESQLSHSCLLVGSYSFYCILQLGAIGCWTTSTKLKASAALTGSRNHTMPRQRIYPTSEKRQYGSNSFPMQLVKSHSTHQDKQQNECT